MHLTIHGFHAAKYVADNLNGVELGQFVHICDQRKTREGTWHVVLQFVTGLLGK